MPHISTAVAAFIGFLLEILLYGSYLMVFYQHWKIVRQRRNASTTYAYQCATALILFVSISMHTIVDMLIALDAYCNAFERVNPKPAGAVIVDFGNVLNKIRIGLYSAEILNVDLFLVYRVWVLWGKSFWVAILPFCLWLVLFSFTIWGNVALMQGATSPAAIAEVRKVAKNPLIATLALNVLCTIMIAGRIWYIQRGYKEGLNSAPLMKNPVSRAMVIIVESAFVYASWIVAMITTEIVGDNTYYMISAFISPIIGLVFSTIIVRSCSQTSAEHAYITTPPPVFKVPTQLGIGGYSTASAASMRDYELGNLGRMKSSGSASEIENKTILPI